MAEALGEQLLAVPLRGADGGPAPPATLPPERPTSWPALLGTRDEAAVPAFTDGDLLGSFRTRTRAIGLPLPEVVRVARACGHPAIVLDPGSSHALVLAGDGERAADDRVPPFWAPSYPVRALSGPLVEADLRVLRLAAREVPEVSTLHAVELVDPDGVVTLVVAVRPGDPGTTRATADAVAERCGDLAHPDQARVDVLAVTGSRGSAEIGRLDVPLHPPAREAPGRVL